MKPLPCPDGEAGGEPVPVPGTRGSSPEAASPHRRAHHGRRGAGGSGCSRDKAAGQPQPPGTRGPGQAMPAAPRDGAKRAARGLRHLSPSERGKSFSQSLGHGQDCPLSRGPSPGSAVGCPQTWGKPGGRGLGHHRGTGRDAGGGQALLPIISTSLSLRHLRQSCSTPLFP